MKYIYRIAVGLLLFTNSISSNAGVYDTIKPVIYLNTQDTVYHEVNHEYTPVGVTCIDNHSDSAHLAILRTTNVNPFIIGIYTDIYFATDSAGNKATKTRWVIVGDTTPPTITSQRPIIQIQLFQSNFDLTKFLILKDNYASPQLLKDSLQVVYDDVNFYEEGIYAIVYITNDQSGNFSNTYNQLVEVVRFISVDNIEEESLSISPNPATYSVNVEGLSSSTGTISLLSSKGEKVLTQKISSNKNVINAGHFAPGVYQLVITTNKGVQSRNVVIQ